MSDIFHELIPDEVILELFKIMNKAKIHIFQVLTKRPERLKKLANKISWTDNIWMGVTVENQKNTNRIDILRQTNAHIKFISFEPLLEEISNLNLENIDWAIVGGESGPGAREIKKEWVMSLKEQCRNYNVKFFFKQWGGVNKKKNGRLLDGKEYNEMPNINIKNS